MWTEQLHVSHLERCSLGSTPNDSLTPMRQVLTRELKTDLTTVTEGWCGEGEVCVLCGVEEEKNWADGFCKRMQQSS